MAGPDGIEVPSSEEESEGEEGEDAPLQSGSEEEEGGGLIVRFDERRAGVAKSSEAAVSQWFSQVGGRKEQGTVSVGCCRQACRRALDRHGIGWALVVSTHSLPSPPSHPLL